VNRYRWYGMRGHGMRAAVLSATVVFILAGLSVAGVAQNAAPVSPTQLANEPALLLGAAWYPEQWPESRWEQDLKLMEEAHIHAVRVAEFAWSTMEPSEGRFEFGWLDRAIAMAGKHHIVVILGTPTAAPPAWLTSKYPETLRVEQDGQRVQHGGRAHGSALSPKYRELCRRIALEMAQHFGHNANVVGWQIDNEYGYALMSYDPASKRQFQDWLQEKFKTLDSLNQHWATAYWSQTYDAWNEIPIPKEGDNPGLMLEWKNFVTDTWVSYQQNQVDAIRAQAEPRQFITGNLMGFFDGFDHYPIAKPLTFVSWDDYVGTGHLDSAQNGLSHDLMRGLKRANFWVLETQPGAVNWAGVNNFLNRGEVRAMAWQAIAHGADYIGYWQWRSALNGQEQYHGVLVGPDGTTVPLLEEVAQVGREFEKTEAAFRGTTPKSEVALLHSYQSRWAIDWQQHNKNYDEIAVLRNYYRALRGIAQSVDVISPEESLDGYKLVVAPDLNLIPQAMAEHLLEFVKNGGYLVLGPRSGMKDEFNSLLPLRQPGFLAAALGGRVEQYYALEKSVPVDGAWGRGESAIWAEQLSAAAADVQILLRYGASNGWLDGQAAAISRAFGKGRITYIGASLDGAVMNAAARWMTEKSRVKPILAVGAAEADGVEVSRRVGGGREVFVVVNTTAEVKQMALPRAMKLLLAEKTASSVELPAYGVEILVEK
jgi:beta-galactosidase